LLNSRAALQTQKINTMKHLFALRLLAYTAIAALAMGLAIHYGPKAHAQQGQGWPTTQTVLQLTTGSTTATTGTIGSGSTTTTGTITSTAFAPNVVTGFGVVPSTTTGTATGSGTLTFYFQTGLSGTGPWSTTYPIAAQTVTSGTSTVIDYINVPANTTGTGCANAPYLRLGKVTNTGTAGTATINSLTIVTPNHV
jgi:hypothetical protein